MNNCKQHKKEIAGISDMKLIAEMIGDLHYEALDILLYHLFIKLKNDGIKDSKAGRKKLGRALYYASKEIGDAKYNINEAWKISKPFMNKPNDNDNL